MSVLWDEFYRYYGARLMSDRNNFAGRSGDVVLTSKPEELSAEGSSGILTRSISLERIVLDQSNPEIPVPTWARIGCRSSASPGESLERIGLFAWPPSENS